GGAAVEIAAVEPLADLGRLARDLRRPAPLLGTAARGLVDLLAQLPHVRAGGREALGAPQQLAGFLQVLAGGERARIVEQRGELRGKDGRRRAGGGSDPGLRGSVRRGVRRRGGGLPGSGGSGGSSGCRGRGGGGGDLNQQGRGGGGRRPEVLVQPELGAAGPGGCLLRRSGRRRRLLEHLPPITLQQVARLAAG